jgi:hypothetical protein
MKTHLTLGLTLILTAAAHAQGTFVLWDESVHGSLSPSSSTPTLLAPLRAGTNSIIGTTDAVPTGGNWSLRPDFFGFEVPNGLTVSALLIQINRPNVWTWVGDRTFLNQLAFVANPSSGDLLSQLRITAIRSGDYGMYMENHDLQPFTTVVNYRLDFVVVPEPSALALVLLGGSVLLALGSRIRRRCSRSDTTTLETMNPSNNLLARVPCSSSRSRFLPLRNLAARSRHSQSWHGSFCGWALTNGITPARIVRNP